MTRTLDIYGTLSTEATFCTRRYPFIKKDFPSIHVPQKAHTDLSLSSEQYPRSSVSILRSSVSRTTTYNRSFGDSIGSFSVTSRMSSDKIIEGGNDVFNSFFLEQVWGSMFRRRSSSIFSDDYGSNIHGYVLSAHWWKSIHKEIVFLAINRIRILTVIDLILRISMLVIRKTFNVCVWSIFSFITRRNRNSAS